MTTETPPLEKCIADDLSHPPVHPEAALNSPGPVEILGHPPQTRLLLGGFDPEAVTVDFLVDIHNLAEEYDLDLESISVGRAESGSR